jgi:hypothetical protein
VNIEHGADNTIVNNTFTNNKCGVHMWWNDNEQFLKTPWGKANYKGIVGNVIAGNTFTVDANHPFGNLPADQKLIALHLRDQVKKPGDPGHIIGTAWFSNSVSISSPNGKEREIDPGIVLVEAGDTPKYTVPQFEVLGVRRPVGAREQLRGRDKIVMTEWGPWDHASPLVRTKVADGPDRVYQLFNMPGSEMKFSLRGDPSVSGGPRPVKDRPDIVEYHVLSGETGVHPYTLDIRCGAFWNRVGGTIVNARWNVTFFPWSTGTDPREHIGAWRALAKSAGAKSVTTNDISFKFGAGGPSTIHLSEDLDKAGLPNDHFGTIATTSLPMTKGRYRFRTNSDDGVRVVADGGTIIENWAWHGPTVDTGELTVDKDRDVAITVEHFEIDGYAVLDFQIERIE